MHEFIQCIKVNPATNVLNVRTSTFSVSVWMF